MLPKTIFLVVGYLWTHPLVLEQYNELNKPGSTCDIFLIVLFQDPLASIPMNNCDMLVMYTFNDKLFPETLNFISGGG